MIALVVGQTPVTTFIGTDPNNLTYEVTEPAGECLKYFIFIWVYESGKQ